MEMKAGLDALQNLLQHAVNHGSEEEARDLKDRMMEVLGRAFPRPVEEPSKRRLEEESSDSEEE